MTLKTHEIECCEDEVRLIVQRMVRIFQMFERDQIKPFGFTISQCYTMIELLKTDQLKMNDISNKMNLSISTMTRNVEKLVRDGYIERTKGRDDKRQVIIKLSEKGRHTTVRLNNSINEYYKNIIENLPTGEVEKVLDSVSLLFSAFEKANPNCC